MYNSSCQNHSLHQEETIVDNLSLTHQLPPKAHPIVSLILDEGLVTIHYTPTESIIIVS